jgi:DNA-binding CsgD family transcriptional regulator
MFSDKLPGLRVVSATNIGDILHLSLQYSPTWIWVDTCTDAEQIEQFRMFRSVCPGLRFVGFGGGDDLAATRLKLGWGKDDLLFGELVPWDKLAASFASLGLMAPGDQGQTLQAVKLTRRMSQLLILLQSGMANQAIAQKLGISEHTVKVHFWRLFRRLGVNNRLQALYKARLLGLIAGR